MSPTSTGAGSAISVQPRLATTRPKAVSGACCLAAAALIPGTVARLVARGLAEPGADYADIAVGIENPAGVLGARITARAAPEGLALREAAYARSAQILLRGHVPLVRASAALEAALEPLVSVRAAA